MSGSRFDDLSKTLAGETSRRGILKALVGGLVALVAGVAVTPKPSEAQVGSCYPTQPCTYNQQATQQSLAFCQANFPSQGPPGRDDVRLLSGTRPLQPGASLPMRARGASGLACRLRGCLLSYECTRLLR